MRVTHVLRAAAASPALLAGLVLAIFAGAGLLIVAAGPAREPVHAAVRARVAPPAAWALAPSRSAADALAAVYDVDAAGPGTATPIPEATPAALRTALRIRAAQDALARTLTRSGADVVLRVIPIGLAAAAAGPGRVSVTVWCLTLAGNAVLGVRGAWTIARLQIVRVAGRWLLAGIGSLLPGPAPAMAAGPAGSRAGVAAAIAGSAAVVP